MKSIAYILILPILFIGCSKEPKILSEKLPQTYLLESSFTKLPNWKDENYTLALNSFIDSCKTRKTQNIYKDLCQRASEVVDAKSFLESEFQPYEINTKNGETDGLLTGYYEPQLRGSLVKDDVYKYPIYTTPSDLITVDLSSIYPDLKNYRLRGKIKGTTLVPYHTREQSNAIQTDADIICYTDSKIDLFFLEIQGSGRVTLENGETIFLGFANQNGHKYRAIGRYLVEIGALNIEEVSLQTIRAWLEKNPQRVDEVLNYNDSLVYFKQTKQPASGSLGVVLTPKRSIAVDKRYIPLGSMLYLDANIQEENFNALVLAQDTGGAIKGAVRADLFLGFGKDAMEVAGELKAPLKLWILLPKETKEDS